MEAVSYFAAGDPVPEWIERGEIGGVAVKLQATFACNVTAIRYDDRVDLFATDDLDPEAPLIHIDADWIEGLHVIGGPTRFMGCRDLVEFAD